MTTICLQLKTNKYLYKKKTCMLCDSKELRACIKKYLETLG